MPAICFTLLKLNQNLVIRRNLSHKKSQTQRKHRRCHCQKHQQQKRNYKHGRIHFFLNLTTHTLPINAKINISNDIEKNIIIPLLQNFNINRNTRLQISFLYLIIFPSVLCKLIIMNSFYIFIE